MARFVAMLRSVNVGGRNRVAMADLRDLVSSLGFDDVTTYLQSGNVVFSGSGSRPVRGPGHRGQRMGADLGLDVPVLVRSGPQLRKVLDANPFAADGVDPKTVHVTFLAARPGRGEGGRARRR